MILFTGEKQTKFEQFVDKTLEGNEVLLLEEILEKLDNGATVEELEISFYKQCGMYFELLETLNIIQEQNEERTGVLQ
jgi:ribosome assembly protein YihI (activator of Der GTPase)